MDAGDEAATRDATEEPLRVLLVDDHTLVRDGLRALLRSARLPLDLVGDAGSGEEAVRVVVERDVDLVIMDLGLPGMSGLEATAVILARRPKTRVVVLSMFDEPDRVERALAAGASAYVLKGDGIRCLLDALEAVARGESYLSAGVTQQVVEGYLRRGRRAANRLTPRETEVLGLVAKGFTGREIAGLLGLSPKTVGNHRTHIMEKLDIHTTAGLVRYALDSDIGL